jgi:hypothetical protein
MSLCKKLVLAFWILWTYVFVHHLLVHTFFLFANFCIILVSLNIHYHLRWEMTFVYEITILLFDVGATLTVANLFHKNLNIFFDQIFLFLSIFRTIIMCLDYFKEESLNAFESIGNMPLCTQCKYIQSRFTSY